MIGGMAPCPPRIRHCPRPFSCYRWDTPHH